MADSSLILSFEVRRNGELIATSEHAEQSVTFGSGEDAMIRVPSDDVAALHCVVNIEDDGSVQLLHLGAESGTHMKGESISNALLKTGDSFQIGELEISVTITDGDGFEEEIATTVAPGAPIHDDQATEVDTQPVVESQAPVGDWEDEEEVTDPGPPSSSADAQNAGDDAGLDRVENVMDFVMRSGTAQSNLGINPKKPKVLEVNQIWGDLLVDTKHFPRDGRAVSVGSSVGYRWEFLGVDMGWIPRPLHMVLPYTPPMWSEVVSDWRNDFYSPDANLPNGRDHSLFVWKDGRYVAEVMKDWDGFVDVEDKRYTFDELVKEGRARRSGDSFEIPIDDDVRMMVDVDGVVFYAQMVRPGKRIIARMAEHVDYPFIAIFSFMGFLGLMFGLVMWLTPPRAEIEFNDLPDRFTNLELQKEEEPPKTKKKAANPDAGEGAKAKKEEGKVGKKDAKMEKAKGAKTEQQKKDREIAENAGVLGALADNGDLDGVFGSSSLNSNLTGGIGGLQGAKGVQFGAGGLGSRGSGLGGGGTAEGIGGMGTKGTGSGASGYGSGGGHLGAKSEGGLGSVGGDPIILGALDRSLIDEVIKRHMNQIRYCYQRELTKDPALGGKIVIKFVIAKDGTVSKASTKSTTMNNAGVENCIIQRFMRMQFPKPKGGGIVIVSYPFLFSPG